MSTTSVSQYDRPLTACPMCQSQRINPYDHDSEGRTISRCAACRLLFMNPQYSDEHLAAYYAGYMFKDPDFSEAEMANRIRSKTDDIQLVERFASPGRFLSIGCGDGLELRLAQQRGWVIEGFDVDPEITRRVAAETGATVYTKDFLKLDLPSKHYDCVFMDQVLEHPKNPQDYLREINRILKIGGVLFVGCPNIKSLSCAWKTTLGKLGLRGNRRGKHYAMFHHLFYYSPPILKRIMEKHYGYNVVVAEGDPLSGQRRHIPSDTLGNRLLTTMRCKIPMLDSTFRLVAAKTEDCAESVKYRAAA